MITELTFNQRDDNGRGLLHGASASGLPEIISRLKDKGLDLNLQDKRGFTPLHEASRNGNYDVTERLLDLGADPTNEDKSHRTHLVVAWRYVYIEVMSVLQSKGKTKESDSVLISNDDNLQAGYW